MCFCLFVAISWKLKSSEHEQSQQEASDGAYNDF